MDFLSFVFELTTRERRRIFNLGYYTWVEQRGVDIADQVERWDELIDACPATSGSRGRPPE